MLFTFSFLLINLSAQSEKTTFERRGHGAFFELGGATFSYTFNYESRFLQKNRGLGFRIGLGFGSLSDVRKISVPIQVNYLLGKNRDRDQAKVLSGNPGLTVDLINSLDFKSKYTSGCLSFEEENIPIVLTLIDFS